MALKPKTQSESKIDWAKINEQLPEDVVEARVAYIVDLGIQSRDPKPSKEGRTYVKNEQEAIELLSRVRQEVGDWVFDKEKFDEVDDEFVVTKNNIEAVAEYIPDVSVGDTVYELPFAFFNRKDSQEVAYLVDCVDTYIEYVSGEEPKQYRVLLNKTDFNTRKLIGAPLTIAKPQVEGGVWTYHNQSLHKRLADAVDVNLAEVDNDVCVMLNLPLFVKIEKNKKGYPKFSVQAIAKKYRDGVSKLDCKPMVIEFDSVTVDELKEAKLNKLVTDKIKEAKNYQGSQMQKALEEYEAFRKGATTAAEDDVSSKDERSVGLKSKAKQAAKSKVDDKVEVGVEDDPWDDDDISF